MTWGQAIFIGLPFWLLALVFVWLAISDPNREHDDADWWKRGEDGP